ncbi:DUF5305 family protein [Halospeciosus flavus]|uniref:DUF5305 family protein n=1 Tax=Halospeciosus flavus TaxID=3032283 RepID=A0ABD5Z3D0_9EURY|nr:DUF5305 family protein [Halospeciosus flavus]
MTSTLRLRYLLAKRGPALVATFLAVGILLLAGAGAVYANPPTTEITDHTDRQTVSTEISAAAMVTGNTSLYERGTTLHDQPVYLLTAAPHANITVATTLPTDVSGTAEHDAELVYTARRGGETFWQHTEPLTVTTTSSATGTVSTMTLSMPDIQEQLAAYQSEFGRAATTDVALRVSSQYTVGQYDGGSTNAYSLTFSDRWYGIETDTVSKTHSTPVTHTRTLPLDSHLPFQLPLVGGIVFVVVGIVTGVTTRRLDAVPEDELADELHHTRYGEWISTGRLPAPTTASTVRMESLEALVDVAIDSGKRVVYDPSVGRYAVLDGDVQYQYEPETGHESNGE